MTRRTVAAYRCADCDTQHKVVLANQHTHMHCILYETIILVVKQQQQQSVIVRTWSKVSRVAKEHGV